MIGKSRVNAATVGAASEVTRSDDHRARQSPRHRSAPRAYGNSGLSYVNSRTLCVSRSAYYVNSRTVYVNSSPAPRQSEQTEAGQRPAISVPSILRSTPRSSSERAPKNADSTSVATRSAVARASRPDSVRIRL